MATSSDDGASRPISDAILALGHRSRARSHPLGRYADALRGSPWRVSSLIAIGGDSLVFKMDDERVLHVSNKILTPELGTRFFDLPMIERGYFDSVGGIQIHYFVQPFAQTPVSERAMRDFRDMLSMHGWTLSDCTQHQLGLFRGEAKLLDPFAAERTPFWRPPG